MRPTEAGRAIMNKRIGTVVAAILAAGIGGYVAFLATKPSADTKSTPPGEIS